MAPPRTHIQPYPSNRTCHRGLVPYALHALHGILPHMRISAAWAPCPTWKFPLALTGPDEEAPLEPTAAPASTGRLLRGEKEERGQRGEGGRFGSRDT